MKTKTKTKTKTAKETTMELGVRHEILIPQWIRDAREIERRIMETYSGIDRDFPQYRSFQQQPTLRITEAPSPTAVKATVMAKAKTKTKTSGGKKSADGKRYFSPEALEKIAKANRDRWAECYHPKCGGKRRPKNSHPHFDAKFGDKYKKQQ